MRVSLSCGVNDVESGEGWTGQGGLQEEGALDGAQRWSLPSQLAFLSLMVMGKLPVPQVFFGRLLASSTLDDRVRSGWCVSAKRVRGQAEHSSGG